MNYVAEYPSSAIIYCVVVAFATLLAVIAEKSKSSRANVFTIMIIALLSCFCGFRSPEVGTDTSHYILMQEQLEQGLFSTVWGEPGFKLLVLLCSKIRVYYFALLVCATLIVSFTIMRLWELRKYFSFSMGVFIYCTYYYFPNFNIIRQCLTMAVVFWATRFLEKRKPKTYIALIVALLFLHSSAIVGLFFLGIYILKYEGLRHNKVRNIALVIVAFIAFVLAFNSSSLRLGRLISKYALRARISFEIMPIFRVLIFLLFEFLGVTYQFSRTRNNSDKSDETENPIYEFTRFSYFAGMVIGIVFSWFSPQNADRVALYLRQNEMLYYGARNENKNLILLKKVVFGAFSLLSFYFTISSGRYGIMPYSMF